MHKTILSTFLFVCIVFANQEPDAKPSELNIHENAQDEYSLKDDQNISEESRIVRDVYSPDYYEPNIILDYRYLKTRGRRYTRGDGGQVLIIPRTNEMAGEFYDYDSLLESLRLSRQADLNQLQLDARRRGKNGYTQHLDTPIGLYEPVEGILPGYDQSQWTRRRG